MRNVVIVSNMYPTLSDPAYGSFVKEQSEILEANGLSIKRIISYDRAEGDKKKAIYKYLTLFGKTMLSAVNPKNKIYHYHYVFPTALTAPLLKKIFRKKIVLTFHGSDLLKGGNKKAKLMRPILKSADEIILVSDYLQKEFIQRFPEFKEKTSSIHCGVNTFLFHPLPKEEVLKELQLPIDTFNILYLGRVINDKGIDVFESVIEDLKEKDNFRFIIVGDGQEKQKMVDKYKSQTNVIFHPSIPKTEVPKWFNAADVFLFPTKREAFGLVALESSACGTPVIAHKVGGVPEIIEDKQSGYLVEMNNPKEFSKRIMELYEKPSLKNSLSIRGFENSKSQTIELQIKKILNLYTKL